MAEGCRRGAEPGGGRLTAGGGVGGGRAVGTARLLDIVAAVWQSVMGWGSAQFSRHGGIRRPCHRIHGQCYRKRTCVSNITDDSTHVLKRANVGHCSVRFNPHPVYIPLSRDSIRYLACLRNTLAIVGCTTRVDSRISQQCSGSPRISHDSLVWSARRGGGGRHTFETTPLSKSGDDLVTLGNPTTTRPALWAERG